MSEIEEFSRYVGLVVLGFAVVLVSPRATAGAWDALRRGFRRPHEDDLDVPVVVHEVAAPTPRRRHLHLRHLHGPLPDEHVEVLDAAARVHGEPLRAALRRGRALAGQAVESRAVLLLLCGLVLRFLGDLVALLPGPAVLAGDLVLVAVTFLVMRRVVYSYVPQQRRDRTAAAADRGGRAHAPFDQILRLVLLSAALVLLVTWPSQLGWQLAEESFGGELGHAAPVVAFACELPWLLAMTWVAVRPRLRPTRAA
jgi:hypothetical protein